MNNVIDVLSIIISLYKTYVHFYISLTKKFNTIFNVY